MSTPVSGYPHLPAGVDPNHQATLDLLREIVFRDLSEPDTLAAPYWDPAATNLLAWARGGPGLLMGWHLINTNAAAAYLHLYDFASEQPGGTPANIRPEFTLQIPGNGVLTNFPIKPVRFRDAIAYSVTGAFGGVDGDGSAPAAACPVVLFID